MTTERCVSNTVRSDVGSCRNSALLHGAGVGTIQQKGRHYLLGSLVPAVQRYVVCDEINGHQICISRFSNNSLINNLDEGLSNFYDLSRFKIDSCILYILAFLKFKTHSFIHFI